MRVYPIVVEDCLRPAMLPTPEGSHLGPTASDDTLPSMGHRASLKHPQLDASARQESLLLGFVRVGIRQVRVVPSEVINASDGL